MTVHSTLRLIFSSIILSLLFSTLTIPVKAQTSSADTLRLTKQKVKDWIQTRIATAKLQNKMKANASDYDDVVQEFFAKRKTLLQSKGWTVEDFEAVQDRIFAAVSAMDTADELAETQEDHEEQVSEIKSNDFYSDEQKEEMIKALNMMRSQKKTEFIEPTQSDWPAVKPYRPALEKLTSWIAGNIPNPPDL